jgi:alkylation response protein AidB-like acyl-CoA dehydrogenase
VPVFGQVSPVAGYAGASALAAKTFTIFEGTSEIQRMLIGRAVTGLDVR